MIDRHNAYDGILAKAPSDPAGQPGYGELVDLWEAASTVLDRHASAKAIDLGKWERDVRPHLSPRERAFFDETHPPEIANSPDAKFAKAISRLTKILLDRHGFKVTKDKGGLG